MKLVESFGETVDEKFLCRVHQGKSIDRSDKRLFQFFSCKTFHDINHEYVLEPTLVFP